MIAFMVLCYVAFLTVLVKFKVVTLTLWWKISPLVFMLLCFVVLIIPMQWGSPSGTVNVYRFVVEIIPNVTGEIVDVAIQPLQSVKKGHVLFQIDRRPFQADVECLEAALSEAEQDVPQLEAAFETATANHEQAIAHRELQRLEVERNESVQKLNEGAVSQRQLDLSRQSLLGAEAAVRAAESAKEQSRLEFRSEINGEHTRVAQLRAQLEAAKLELDWTAVRAPANGYAMHVALRPGQRVASFPVRSWLAFVDENETRIAVGIGQYQLRHIKEGQSAEVIFKLYPGRTFAGEVDSVVGMNSAGQMVPTGVLHDPATMARLNQEFAVILKLDDTDIDANQLPGGAIGTAAIYTEDVKMTHIIRRVELRMQSWLNYLIP